MTADSKALDAARRAIASAERRKDARPSPDTLLGVTEIALRLGVKPNTVSQWRLRNIGFPAPLVDLSMGPVWWWDDIQEWVESR